MLYSQGVILVCYTMDNNKLHMLTDAGGSQVAVAPGAVGAWEASH